MSRLSIRAIVILMLALHIVLVQSSEGKPRTNVGECIISEEDVDDLIPDVWVSDMFYRALANFTLRRAPDTDCRRQSAVYETHLRNHTSWAVRMRESWNRYPVGILVGNTYQMGDYDECVELGVRYPVKGQYCLPEIKLIPSTGRNYSFERTEDLDDFGINHAWKTVLGWGDYEDQIQRNVLKLGMCIPDACSALDLQTSLQSEFDEVFHHEHFKTIVKVDPIMCRVREDMFPYDTSYYVTMLIFSLLVVICCGVTLHHFIRISYQQNKNENGEVPNSFFYDFSLIVSIKSLLKFDKDNELNYFYTLKTMTTVGVVLGHKLLFLISSPFSNSKFLEKIYLNGPAIMLTSFNAVDPFFFISGFIMYINLSREFRKTKDESVWKTLLMPIIQRILRLLPAYCVVMAITAHIIPHLGDGPLWPLKSWEEAEICKNYWWTNLLFISNFVDVKYQCLYMSWHLSCDMQFFIIGVIVVYILMKNQKKGIALLGTIIGLSISVPFIITLLTGRDGMDKYPVQYVLYIRNILSLNESYRPSYMRATPFFSGLAMSIVVEKFKRKNVKFSQIVVHSGLFTIWTFTFWVQFYGAVFYTRNRPYYPLEHALYSTLCHCTWAVAGTWMTITYFTSGYGFLNNVFNNRLTVFMGKLSYSVMLWNITVILTSQSSQRLPVHMSAKYWIDAWLYDLFICYLVAIIIYLIVEEPFAKLIKRLLYQRKNTKSSINFGSPIGKPTISNSNTVKED
ncbi:nose resistant to fluoxetine protein 6-like [Rhopalosiphum padi]|uniref:nose resistant to fluoxetine protein 6-like n=1 Tax=Rhopalosiphum padi TaxID=40932 RepID=UPI00298E4412|nr:nose resistant to fluoxetine protein 6-like [Rhopalosiphum padi]